MRRLVCGDRIRTDSTADAYVLSSDIWAIGASEFVSVADTVWP